MLSVQVEWGGRREEESSLPLRWSAPVHFRFSFMMNSSNRSFNQTSKASSSTQVSFLLLSLSLDSRRVVDATSSSPLLFLLAQPYDSPSGTQKFVIGKIDGMLSLPPLSSSDTDPSVSPSLSSSLNQLESPSSSPTYVVSLLSYSCSRWHPTPSTVSSLDWIPFPPLTFGSRTRFNRKHCLYPQHFSREISRERILGFAEGDQRVFWRERTRGSEVEN